jgi:chromosome segregation ATPase
MEFEQVIKRLDWLDEERRKDKTTIATLEERLNGLVGELKAANQKINDLNTALSKVNATPARLEQVESALALQRTDILKHVDSIEAKRKESQLEAEKSIQVQFENLNEYIVDLRKLKTPLAEIKRELKVQADDEFRRKEIQAEWATRLQEIGKTVEKFERSQQVFEESRKTESKRLIDLQGDLAAARKRLDEVREKHEIFNDGLRRVETRINELISNEADRRQAQVSFIESNARVQVERERSWKEWEASLGSFQKNSEILERRLQEWDVSQRAVKRAQETYEEIVQKFERRINEISEMQRLAEDRFRQEWVTFKADDQKRWTSFTLSQDEVRKDIHTELGKLQERITALDDQTQTQQDVLEQTKDANEQLFQGMLAQIHELLSAYERIMSKKP